jgi:uncharacterized cupin superfamily protein
MPAGTHSSEPDIDPVMAAAMIGGLFGLFLVLLVAVEWPVFVWSLIHARPMLLEPTDAIGGGLHNLFAHDHFGIPRVWRPVAPLLPPKAAWIALDVSGLLMVLVAAAVWLRTERWSGRSTLSLPWWDPRRKLRPRAWAKPRHWLHQQPRWDSRSGLFRRASNRMLRLLMGERRGPAPVGGDSYNLGRLRGAEVRSGREMHMLVVAPTRSGKTRRVVAYEYGEEEWILVLAGRPSVRTRDGVEELAPGALMFFPRGPQGAHQVRNDGEEPARVAIFSTIVLPTATAYPDSGKVGVYTGDPDEDLIAERASGVDYYRGEA